MTQPTGAALEDRPALDAKAIRKIVHKNVNVVTPLTGATIKLGPMVTAPPAAEVTDEHLTDFAADSGLNAAFLADQLSAFIAHERDAVNLLRSLASLSTNPMLRRTYQEFAEDSEQAARIWADLILDLGGNPQYASPAGRMTEMLDGKMQEAMLGAGSADPMTVELAGMRAAMLGAHLCVTNIELLEAMAGKAKGKSAKSMKAAAGKLRPLAEKHHTTAMQTINTMVLEQAKHPMMQRIGQATAKAAKLVGKAKKGARHSD